MGNSQVIRVLKPAPPSRNEQLATAFCSHEHQIYRSPVSMVSNWTKLVRRTFRILSFAEFVLLIVAGAEDVVANEIRNEDDCSSECAKNNGIEGKVARLKGVDKWNPC